MLIDCPPSLGILTFNALTACDRLLVPIQCEYYALEGVGQLVRTVDLVRDSLNPSLEVSGILLTLYDSRTRLANEVADEVRRQFGSVVFDTVVPRNVIVAVRRSNLQQRLGRLGQHLAAINNECLAGDISRLV